MLRVLFVPNVYTLMGNFKQSKNKRRKEKKEELNGWMDGWMDGYMNE